MTAPVAGNTLRGGWPEDEGCGARPALDALGGSLAQAGVTRRSTISCRFRRPERLAAPADHHLAGVARALDGVRAAVELLASRSPELGEEAAAAYSARAASRDDPACAAPKPLAALKHTPVAVSAGMFGQSEDRVGIHGASRSKRCPLSTVRPSAAAHRFTRFTSVRAHLGRGSPDEFCGAGAPIQLLALATVRSAPCGNGHGKLHALSAVAASRRGHARTPARGEDPGNDSHKQIHWLAILLRKRRQKQTLTLDKKKKKTAGLLF